MRTIEKELTVLNKLGLHARSAATIVKELNKYKSKVVLKKGNTVVDGKSILDIITLDCPRGARVHVEITGEDAAEAMKALTELFSSRFGED